MKRACKLQARQYFDLMALANEVHVVKARRTKWSSKTALVSYMWCSTKHTFFSYILCYNTLLKLFKTTHLTSKGGIFENTPR